VVSGHRTEEGRVPEGEDAAIGGHQPVAAVVSRAGDPHDGRVQVVSGHRACEGRIPEGEDAPSAAVSQYPRPSDVAAMPTMGAFRCVVDMSSKKIAAPNGWTFPSAAASQYPFTTDDVEIPTIGAAPCSPAAEPKNDAVHRRTPRRQRPQAGGQNRCWLSPRRPKGRSGRTGEEVWV